MAAPPLAPCGGSLREAQAGRRSLGLIGCWQWNAAGRILLTRALSSTVTPLAALLKPPSNEKCAFNLFKITITLGSRIMGGLLVPCQVTVCVFRMIPPTSKGGGGASIRGKLESEAPNDVIVSKCVKQPF